MADFRERSVLVVRRDFEHQGHATGAVPLINGFFEGRAGELAGALLEGALDVVGRHVLGLRSQDRGAQPRIRVGITAGNAGRNRNFLDELGEDLPPPGVKRSLLVFDGRPFRMTRHRRILSKNLSKRAPVARPARLKRRDDVAEQWQNVTTTPNEKLSRQGVENTTSSRRQGFAFFKIRVPKHLPSLLTHLYIKSNVTFSTQ